MTQIQMAAQRRETILNVLRQSHHPLTLDEIYEKPEVKALCKGKYNVNDDLKSMKGKEVYKEPSNKSSHRYAYSLLKRANQVQHKQRPIPAVTPTESGLEGLDTLKVFLSDDEYLGFLKGALIMFPEHKSQLMGLIENNSKK
jgi:predicted Zn-ribbon and HTH transcriptional regulator